VVIDRERIVFYFVKNVNLGIGTQEEHLGGDSRITNLLETTDFVIRDGVDGLAWVLRVLTLCKPRLERPISRCSGLHQVVELAGFMRGLP
jgi:hypothetical protein